MLLLLLHHVSLTQPKNQPYWEGRYNLMLRHLHDFPPPERKAEIEHGRQHKTGHYPSLKSNPALARISNFNVSG